jgi:hypothetical protein
MSCPSLLEFAVYKLLTAHPFRKMPHPTFWATEAAVFLKCKGVCKGLEKCKVDVVFFEQLCVATESMKRNVLFFADGKGHFPWRSANQPGSSRDGETQRAIDMGISVGASSVGYKILRVAEEDMASLLRMIEIAWRERHIKSGWVKVSRHWNTGAHREAAVVVGRA